MSKPGLQPGGIAHSLAALQPGECYSRTKMVGMNHKNLDATLRDTRRRMRNVMTKQIERAGKESGNSYRMDSGTWHATEDATIFLTVAVTRII